jgi:Type I phosphodiesterase / nucleotide pyrophosphatase
MRTSAQGLSLNRRRKRRRRALALALVVAVALAVAGFGFFRGSEGDEIQPEAKGEAPPPCQDTPAPILQRLRRGYFPGRSGDVIAAERLPNQFGTRHSTPWSYTQDIPLVFYGPGYIKRGFSSESDVTLADIVPTLAELLAYDGLGERDGRSLDEALLPPERRNGVPQLILTIAWDGGGDNALAQWPDSWPNLRSLLAQSASFENATVGSTPSITPSAHATMGTGFFPSTHGLTDIPIRIKGRIIDSWESKSPRNLRVETLADLWDRANGNVPLVGLLARDSWHAGMMGHGSYLEGADQDISVLDSLGKLEFTSNEDYYSFPSYAASLEGLEEAVQEVDLRDGEADGEWLGNPMNMDGKIRETPAWSIFQSQKLFDILETEGFGQDDVADLFFTNYKAVDLTGHSYNIVEPEVRDNLEEQDRQLDVIIQGLNELVGRDNYVLVLTADHGMTPYPEVTGGWSIDGAELIKDLERQFNTERPNRDLVTSNRGYQFFFNRKVMRANDVTYEDLSAFIRNYRLHENAPDPDQIPNRFRDRLNERLYLTAMSARELKLPACQPD